MIASVSSIARERRGGFRRGAGGSTGRARRACGAGSRPRRARARSPRPSSLEPLAEQRRAPRATSRPVGPVERLDQPGDRHRRAGREQRGSRPAARAARRPRPRRRRRGLGRIPLASDCGSTARRPCTVCSWLRRARRRIVKISASACPCSLLLLATIELAQVARTLGRLFDGCRRRAQSMIAPKRSVLAARGSTLQADRARAAPGTSRSRRCGSRRASNSSANSTRSSSAKRARIALDALARPSASAASISCGAGRAMPLEHAAERVRAGRRSVASRTGGPLLARRAARGVSPGAGEDVAREQRPARRATPATSR